MTGPFAGMRYVAESVGSVLPPKLMGTYEKELHEVWDRLLAAAPIQPIVVGAAEGYYAVGMARWPSVERVVAFEAVTSAHPVLTRMAALNGVTNKIELHGLCDCSALSAALASCPDPHPLLVVDVEGAESILLDPIVVPRLRACTMLVEMHDGFVPGLEGRMRERFAASHHIERIDAAARTAADLPEAILPLPRFTASAAVFAMNEGRYQGMYWWFMVPKETGPRC